MICGDTYVTQSKVLPLYTELLEHIDIFLKISALKNEMKGAIIKCKDTLERCYGATSHSCTVATMLDPLFRLGYYSVRYDEDPNKNVDPGDILRIARHIYTSGCKTSASDVASTEPQSFIPNEFGSRMFKKPRTAVVTSIDEFDIYMRGSLEGPMTLPLMW